MVLACGISHQTRDIELMLAYCWASVSDAGPTITRHWFNVSFLMAYCLLISGWSWLITDLQESETLGLVSRTVQITLDDPPHPTALTLPKGFKHKHKHTAQQTPDVEAVLVRFWPIVYDAGPTSTHTSSTCHVCWVGIFS